jgi:hypothetical protein
MAWQSIAYLLPPSHDGRQQVPDAKFSVSELRIAGKKWEGLEK